MRYILWLAIPLLFTGCVSTSSQSAREVTTSAVITHGTTYEYPMGSFGDEEGAIIENHPDQYSRSELERNGDEITYYFEPALYFKGEVTVILQEKRNKTGIIGGQRDGDQITITIQVL